MDVVHHNAVMRCMLSVFFGLLTVDNSERGQLLCTFSQCSSLASEVCMVTGMHTQLDQTLNVIQDLYFYTMCKPGLSNMLKSYLPFKNNE